MTDFERKSVKLYPSPGYPSSGYEIPDAALTSFFRGFHPSNRLLALFVTGLLPLSIISCSDSEQLSEGGIPAPPNLFTEADVRIILHEKFSEMDLIIEEDFHFRARNVAFCADGFDELKEVGYEFLSQSDFNGINTSEDSLSFDEIELLDELNLGEGPYFLILHCYEYGYSSDEHEAEQRENLKVDIHEYLQQLVDRGII